jgi:hypothetical protein
MTVRNARDHAELGPGTSNRWNSALSKSFESQDPSSRIRRSHIRPARDLARGPSDLHLGSLLRPWRARAKRTPSGPRLQRCSRLSRVGEHGSPWAPHPLRHSRLSPDPAGRSSWGRSPGLRNRRWRAPGRKAGPPRDRAAPLYDRHPTSAATMNLATDHACPSDHLANVPCPHCSRTRSSTASRRAATRRPPGQEDARVQR